MNQRTRVITLRLPESTYERVKQAAASVPTSLNKFCLEAVDLRAGACGFLLGETNRGDAETRSNTGPLAAP